MTRLVVVIPDELHEAVRRRAFEERTSMAEQVRRALTVHVGPTLQPAPLRQKRPPKVKRG